MFTLGQLDRTLHRLETADPGAPRRHLLREAARYRAQASPQDDVADVYGRGDEQAARAAASIEAYVDRVLRGLAPWRHRPGTWSSVTPVGCGARGGPMRYTDLGETGMSVSVVGLGTWQFGGEYGKHFTPSEVDRLVGRAGELGVNLIDTAECYGDHLAEQLVGQAIRNNRGSWIVATKFGHQFHADRTASPDAGPGSSRTDRWAPEEVVAQLEASLRALGTDYVDVYQSHAGSDAQFATPGLWEALLDQVSAGKIRHLGISLDTSEEERAAGARARGAGVVQVTYNRLNRAAEETILPIAAEQGLGVLAREPLANGFLSGRYRPGSRITTPGDWRASQDPADLDARLAEVQRIAGAEAPTGLPLARWAIGWCLRHPAVSAVIPGCKTIEQLESNVAAADLPVPEDRQVTQAQPTQTQPTQAQPTQRTSTK